MFARRDLTDRGDTTDATAAAMVPYVVDEFDVVQP